MNKTLSHKGRPVFYRISGSGNPVMLLHGFAEDGEVWKEQAGQLEKDYQVIIPDLPGSGLSELPEDVSMHALAETAKAILEEEKIDSTVLIGHSMGGYITLAFAERYPHFLKAFGLFHSTAFADSPGKKTVRKKSIEFIRSHNSLEYLKQSVPNLFSEGYKKNQSKEVDIFIDRHKHFNPVALAAYQQAMIDRPDRTDALKKFVKPVLFIIGKYDNAIPFNDSLKLCHLPSLSYIHILGESGHMGMMEESEKSNLILRSFLQDVC